MKDDGIILINRGDQKGRSNLLANQGYDPNESRIPAGQREGGQWTTSDTGSGQLETRRSSLSRGTRQKGSTHRSGQEAGKIAREDNDSTGKDKNADQSAKRETEGDFPTGDPRFDKFINFVFAHENVYDNSGKVIPENVAGDSGGLTKYGIDQASHPGVDIAGLNKQKATAIYYELWKKHGISKMKYPLGEAYFDTVVNGGGSAALHASGGDAKKLIDQKVAHYMRIVKRNPSKAKFLKVGFRGHLT